MPCCWAVTQIDGRAQRFQSILITGLNPAESRLELLSLVGYHFLEMMAVLLHLSLQTLLLEGAFQTQHDNIGLEWFDEIIVCALSHGAHTHTNVVHARTDQECQFGISSTNLRQKLHS